MSLGMSGILGINTKLPFPQPVMISASITFGIKLMIHRRVPLHSLGASRFLESIIGAPTLRIKLWEGIPGGSKELRNSVGY